MNYCRVMSIIIIIIRHAPCQCVAPLATNSLHSGLSMASPTAPPKARLRRDRSPPKAAIQEAQGRPTGLLQSLRRTPARILPAPAAPSTPAKWPNNTSLPLRMIPARGGRSAIRLTPRPETRWYQRTSRIPPRHHRSSASIFLESAGVHGYLKFCKVQGQSLVISIHTLMSYTRLRNLACEE